MEWSSFTEVDEHFKQATDVKLMIRLIFQKLEKVHGRTFISKALSLLTAAKEGISVVELEGIAKRWKKQTNINIIDHKDIISCDEEVLTSIYEVTNLSAESYLM